MEVVEKTNLARLFKGEKATFQGHQILDVIDYREYGSDEYPIMITYLFGSVKVAWCTKSQIETENVIRFTGSVLGRLLGGESALYMGKRIYSVTDWSTEMEGKNNIHVLYYSLDSYGKSSLHSLWRTRSGIEEIYKKGVIKFKTEE